VEVLGFLLVFGVVDAVLAESATRSRRQWPMLSGVPRMASSRTSGWVPFGPVSEVWRALSTPVGGGVRKKPMGRSNPRERARSSSAENCLMRRRLRADRSSAEKLASDSVRPR
jgi:hypothetical protein